jgi:eukaryotic-like serine/threonine-protein kinase
MSAPLSSRMVGRYMIHESIAAGGMATVHFGRLVGPVGFTRTVAIKRLHPQYAQDPEFVGMFIDEARLAARIRHPNVVQTLDVVASGAEVLLVMDYIQGEPLSRLRRLAAERDRSVPPRVVSSIFCGVLHGLHAAHEAKSDQGKSLDIVHRDVSPQNILVGTDGIARVLDFGVAKAMGRSHTTRDGNLKGKLTYMAPEQLEGQVSRRTDVFAAGIVLWEVLTGQRLFAGQDEVEVVGKILGKVVDAPSKHMRAEDKAAMDPASLDGLDAVTLKSLSREPEGRYETARDMALALEKCVGVASPTEVGQWVEETAGGVLDERARRVAEIESQTSGRAPHSVPQPSVRAGEVPPPAADPPVQVELASQASSVSLSSHTPARRPNSWATTAVVSIGVALGASLGFAALWTRGERASDRSSSEAPVTHAPATSETAPSPAASAASATEPTSAPAAPTPSAGLPPAAGSVETAASSRAPTPREASPSTAQPSPRKSAATPKPDCSTPYTIDSDGKKHFKEECFR